jgi:putative endonuclease
VTNDLIRRVYEHRSKLVESFTEKYDVIRLVYFEQFDDPENAIKRSG